MIQPIQLGKLMIGNGIPKICVPITGRTREDIIRQAEGTRTAGADLVEWRADFFENVENLQSVKEVLSTVRAILCDIPLLFTFRTQEEGGVLDISTKYYVNLNTAAAETKLVDAVDVEIFRGDEIVQSLIQKIHHNGCVVVGSNHHFTKTPAKEELLAIFDRMELKGADILKIAAMPRDPQDVLTLLAATHEETKRTTRPIITMSMAGMGAVSRISGEVFGSSVTFAATEACSAPGQLPIEEMRQMLGSLHRSMQ
ncbi:type I 3-dehydroquinate dehydratase [Ruminococcus sp. OA3]|uniref:type I 3-dehydroquinate dehydratase n=1 Tax=Ruminococcus sp. OA3 TaxID=2914164 RepID=UPI001F06249D|nr:type I 3-dehydroquinate dehydratase [Ruminococcus sp. OA3]MCH1982311.1 type I 3-dehydroquinate dehydratase [Ruminococcus sp. OA3]